ncbi:RidA family protein [Tabrizicola sp. YIM 78059]|uniref:RidA family protein n=1 Tax=Tabrizicola sp. YIM 78059 TaxID=2529861 RepID=UPI00352F291D
MIVQILAFPAESLCRSFGKARKSSGHHLRRLPLPPERQENEMRSLNPPSIARPFAAYAHGVELPAGARLVVTSGQLALAPDGSVPEGAEAQARLCFANCAAILAEAGMGPADVVRINAFVTDRAHMAGYMAARDAWLSGVTRLPASTLVIVAGFTRPEFLVEVEVTAARP